MLPSKFQIIWPSGFRGEVFRNRPIKNKNCQWRPCLLMDQNEMSSLYRGPPIDASYQVSVHLAKQLQKRRIFFLNQPIRNKSRLWRPCLLTDQDEMSNEGLPYMLPTKCQVIWLRVLETYLSVIQFIANCILLISIFKLELSPFPQNNGLLVVD